MPSAADKIETKTTTENTEILTQAVSIIEKKIRNLEKRKGKLSVLQSELNSGKKLNEDQLQAVSCLKEVSHSLEMVHELHHQFTDVINGAKKNEKKNQRKEQQEQAARELRCIKEILVIQDVVNNMGGDGVREDFLSGSHFAPKLTDQQLDHLDEFYKLISPQRQLEDDMPPFQDQVSSAADHLKSLMEGKQKEVAGTTYQELKEVIQKVDGCRYFDAPRTEQEEQGEEPALEGGVGQEEDTSEETQLEGEVAPTETEHAEVENRLSEHPESDEVVAVDGQRGSDVPVAVTHPCEPGQPTVVPLRQPDTCDIEQLEAGANIRFLQDSQIRVAREPEAHQGLAVQYSSGNLVAPAASARPASPSSVKQSYTGQNFVPPAQIPGSMYQPDPITAPNNQVPLPAFTHQPQPYGAPIIDSTPNPPPPIPMPRPRVEDTAYANGIKPGYQPSGAAPGLPSQHEDHYGGQVKGQAFISDKSSVSNNQYDSLNRGEFIAGKEANYGGRPCEVHGFGDGQPEDFGKQWEAEEKKSEVKDATVPQTQTGTPGVAQATQESSEWQEDDGSGWTTQSGDNYWNSDQDRRNDGAGGNQNSSSNPPRRGGGGPPPPRGGGNRGGPRGGGYRGSAGHSMSNGYSGRGGYQNSTRGDYQGGYRRGGGGGGGPPRGGNRGGGPRGAPRGGPGRNSRGGYRPEQRAGAS